MDVCAGCGIVAPRPGLPCEACGRTATRAAPGPRGALYFVAARCQFQCRGCGRLAPLDEVDVSGVVRCVLCGLGQAFDPGAWRDALAFAHAVGDLAGGEGVHPDRRWSVALANPHAEVGRACATARLTTSGARVVGGLEVTRSLRMVAAPGHPLCACGEPLQVDPSGEGALRTRCAGCGANAAYDVPAAVVGACGGLRGVIAEGRRADLGDARTLDGAVGLSCGGCGAPLRPTPGATTVECAFCHLVSRVPRELVPLRADVAPTPFWLVFSGPSMARRELLRGETNALPIRTAPEVPVSGWRGFLASVVVAGGMLAGTGIVLFVLLRLGLVPLSAIAP